MTEKSTPPPKLTGAAYVRAVVSEYIATTPIRPMDIAKNKKKKPSATEEALESLEKDSIDPVTQLPRREP